MKQKLFDLKCAECNKFFRNPNENERFCPECNKIKESKKKQKPKVKAIKSKSIWQITRELEQYNKEHKTRLSYGQYVALVDK
jgi:predicted transcriptional regulator